MRFTLTWFFVRPLRDAAFPAIGDGVRLEASKPAGARDGVIVRCGAATAHVSAVFDTPGGPMLGGSFTLPEFRGRGLYPLALRWLCARLARQGEPRAWVSCDIANAASRRGILAAGFRYDRAVIGLEVGRWDPGRWIDGAVRRLHRLSPG